MDAAIAGLLAERVPAVAALGRSSFDLLVATARAVDLAPGDTLLRPGDACTAATLVLSGEVRVHRESPAGRGLTLYRVGPGAMCALSALCVQTSQPFPARADAVAPTLGVAVPAATFRVLLDAEPAWRSSVFEAMWSRVDLLLERLEDVTFSGLPGRLARALLERSGDGTVALTHERLAAEVGASREAVSRLLERWEREGIVALSRGRIGLRDRQALLALGRG